MDENNLVSIIMPVYNSEAVLTDTLDAILDQTYQNWELIAVDDCSSDNSYSVLKNLSGKDSRIKCFKNNNNLGSPLTRNEALKCANGRFVAFCDADDIFNTIKLEVQIKQMLLNKQPFTYTYYRRASDDLSRIGHLITPPHRISFKKLVKNTAISTSTVMIDTNVIPVEDIFMEDHQSHDYLCWIKILKKINFAYCVRRDLLRYRVLGNSYSQNKKNMILGNYDVYRNKLNMSFVKSLYCLFCYAYNALKKYSRF